MSKSAKNEPAKNARETSVANLAVVVGVLSSDPRVRELPSGSVLASLEVITSSTPCETVPVAVFDPAPSLASVEAGDAVLMVGRIRRRFFRAGGSTESRTELVADRIAHMRVRRSVNAAYASAADQLFALGETLTP